MFLQNPIDFLRGTANPPSCREQILPPAAAGAASVGAPVGGKLTMMHDEAVGIPPNRSRPSVHPTRPPETVQGPLRDLSKPGNTCSFHQPSPSFGQVGADTKNMIQCLLLLPVGARRVYIGDANPGQPLVKPQVLCAWQTLVAVPPSAVTSPSNVCVRGPDLAKGSFDVNCHFVVPALHGFLRSQGL
ncbi:hypothetical protein K470DRAFT_263666 [Piedraia hortae CBS 480.64]|uniref:Uncharacterized protein n=1 Tax=Piedraia hortae CBS 480.64 TaxID=1314780 RepID=A0A6A7C3J9_9PEZI|nr:hypothetical protein K470DRAFT_263666 [Piedraia hortae CBS 480.64]